VTILTNSLCVKLNNPDTLVAQGVYRLTGLSSLSHMIASIALETETLLSVTILTNSLCVKLNNPETLVAQGVYRLTVLSSLRHTIVSIALETKTV
jgi:hypothetical protein